MKEMLFNENIIRYEAVVDTPLRDEFSDIALDRQLEMVEVVVKDVERFAFDNNLTICRKTWEQYKKSANWKELAKEAMKSKGILERVREGLAKINFIF